MKSMRWPAGVSAALALALAGCGGTTAQVGSGASSIVPASAPAFVAIDADPTSAQWRTINELASKFPDKQKAVDSFKRDMSKEGVSWEQDIKPILQGELDFVWLDFNKNGEDFVALFQPKDEAKFKAFVDKANKSESDPSSRAVYEKFRGWYVIASDHATIDRFEQQSTSQATSLADDKSFAESMDRLGHDSVVRAYVNGKFLMKLARQKGGAKIQPYIDKVGKLDWIALRMGATSEGVGLDTIVHGTPGSLFKGSSKTAAFSPKLVGSVPADALVYLSFHGSKGMFNGLEQNPALSTPEFRQFAQPLKQIGRILEGENAIYLRPGQGMPEVTLVATPPKGVDGAAIVHRLVKRYAGGSAPSLYYANVGGRLVVSDQQAALRAAKGSGKSLSDSDEYRQTKDASGMPDKTWSTLYVNIHTSVPYVERLAGSHIPAEIARNVKPLRSAVEYAASHTHELQVSFFLRIK
jgi:hypothetical protein